MADQPGVLSFARYGKDLVRVARVVREGTTHHIAEYTVRALLEGDIEQSYTKADNSCVVATDTIKNTVNIFAKTSPHVLDPAAFALHLGLHFTTKYPHIHRAFIDIFSHKWSRIVVDGKPHSHAFTRDGEEKMIVNAVVDAAEGATLKCGLRDLLVLKTTGSAFENFHRDEFTTLAPVSDRIFSTSVDLSYTVALPSNTPLTIDTLPEVAKSLNFGDIAKSAKQVTLEVFAEDESASVQATMYNTAQKVLVANPAISDVTYSYPNKHYIPVNLSAFNLDNGLGREGGAEVFWPVADPSGLIQATVTRK